jgi:hypothetical protein
VTDDLHWHRRSWDKPFKIGMVGQLTATTREQHEHAIVNARCSTSSQKAKVYDLFPPAKSRRSSAAMRRRADGHAGDVGNGSHCC